MSTPRSDAAASPLTTWRELPQSSNLLLVEVNVARELEHENAKLRGLMVKLLLYTHMLARGTKPTAAYADVLPYVIADAEAALKPL